MNEEDVTVMLKQAIENLFKNQPNIFDFTPETGQTEWNLAHHLAIEVREFFKGLDHDLEVTKRNYGDRRPDIIFHKTVTH